MHGVEDPEYYDLDPPTLFSPHIYVPERGEKLTFGPKGYMMRLSRFMVSDYDGVRPILAIAKKYNLKATWKRVLEVLVHQAQDLEKQVIHDVRCKLVVGNQIERTRLVDCSLHTCVWDETLKFHVGDPCTVDILLYCKNKIIPNDKLGRISILPLELIERSTVTEWFPLNTKGKLKLTISLSPPALAPFKFVYNYVNAAREWFILGPNDETLFTVLGQWPYTLTISDYNSANVDYLSIQNLMFKSQEKEFDIKIGWGDTMKKVTLSYRWDREFQVKGYEGAETIKSSPSEFAIYSRANICVGSAKAENVSRYSAKYTFEIRPAQDVILILATMFLIAKLRHIRG